jgi:carbohydrate-binding DOMON domain-containing protein
MTNPTVHRRGCGYDRCRQRIRTKDFRIVRFRFALALMVAGMLFAAGIASAQSTTTTPTDPTSGYTNTVTSGYTNTVTTPTQTTEQTETTAPTTEAQEESSVAPAVAAQPAGSAPSSLAFTGGEPLLLIIAGLAITGGTAALLVRDRRRGNS